MKYIVIWSYVGTINTQKNFEIIEVENNRNLENRILNYLKVKWNWNKFNIEIKNIDNIETVRLY